MAVAQQRDADKIRASLKEVNGQIIALKECTITFPVRFETIGLASVGSNTSFYGLFKIATVDGYYAIHNCMATLHSDPDSVETVTHDDGEPYYVLTYKPGSVVITDTELLQDKNIVTKVYKEFITRGKVPYYITYDDMNKVFDTVKSYAGENIGNTYELLAVPISIIARNPNDLNQYYREILDEVDPSVVLPVYVPASSVNFSANSAMTKITGGYFYSGVVSAINNPTDETEAIDHILRY